MLEHIKAFFAKLPVRNLSKRKVLATVSALAIIVSVVTVTAFAAAATYKVTVNEAGKTAYTVSTRADSVENSLKITLIHCHSANMIISTHPLLRRARIVR